MDKWERSPMAQTPHWRGQNNPSFSASLLDAIYRSIDEPEDGSPDLARHSDSKLQGNPRDKRWTLPSPTPAYPTRSRDLAENRGPRCVFSASSSSECSSFGGFSSSDADSVPRLRPVLARCDRIRSDPPPERKRPGSIRSRLRDLRNMGTPASPRTRLSAFLTAIFSGGAGNTKKPKFAGGEEEPETSNARSRNSKTPAASREPSQYLPARASGDRVAARDPRMEVDELLRRFGLEEAAEEESDCESVSSSDLFELDSLSAAGRYKDELPVYGTTSLSTNRAIARRFNA